jgi:hypothetical protein
MARYKTERWGLNRRNFRLWRVCGMRLPDEAVGTYST